MSDDDTFWGTLDRVSYHWLRNRLNDDEAFTEQAAQVLKRLRHGNHNHVYGSAEALLNYWAEERELAIYQRGTPIDVAEVTLYADENGQFDAAEIAVEQGWRVDRAELIALMERYAMPVPTFLCPIGRTNPDCEDNAPPVELTPRGVTRNVIIGAFSVRSDPDENIRYWDDKLSDPPQWLRSARISPGKPGVSATWNPLLVGHALLWKKQMTLRQLDRVMRTSFSEHLEKWQADTATVR